MEYYKSNEEILKEYNAYLKGEIEFKPITSSEKLKFVYLKANTLSGYIKAISEGFVLLQVVSETNLPLPAYTLITMPAIVDISEKGRTLRKPY